MPASLMVNMSYPKPRESLAKYIRVTTADTVAFIGAMLPKDAAITGIYIIGSVLGDAGSVLNIGTTVAANELVSAFPLDTLGRGYVPAGIYAFGLQLTNKLLTDKPIYVNTTALTGGSWTVKIEYTVVGGGEDIRM